MVRQRRRQPRGVSTDGDGFDARARLDNHGLLSDGVGVDTGEDRRLTSRALPAPGVLSAIEAFIGEHCEPCRSGPPAGLIELYDAAIETGTTGVADMVLRDFSYGLDVLGFPLCRTADGLPPCMSASRGDRWRPPCGRVPGPADGDGVTTRHRFRYFSCRGGLALKPDLRSG
jgi:hypothetical protein